MRPIYCRLQEIIKVIKQKLTDIRVKYDDDSDVAEKPEEWQEKYWKKAG